LEAAAPPGLGKLSFWVDGQRLASLANDPYQAWWTLSKGVHQAWVQTILESGETLTSEIVTFEVK
jgi:hypothetical protein